MTVKARTVQPMSILRYAAVTGPLIVAPAGDTAAICAAQAFSLNTPLLLNGLGVVNVGLSAILPFAVEPVITPAVNTDVFTLTFTGLDTFGSPLVLAQPHPSGVVSQRMAAATGIRMFSRIDSIIPTSVTSSTGNVSIGWKFAQAADGGAGANQAQRIPLPVPAPNQGDLLGLYVVDGGGGTFAAGNGQGAFLKSGLANFAFGPATGPVTYIQYGANPSVLPTRPVIYLPVYAPGVNGAMSGNGGNI